MLICNAEIEPGTLVDMRIANANISAIGKKLARNSNEMLIDAQGAGVLAGLHDHHMHLMGYAAALESIPCGPPQTNSPIALAQALVTEATQQPPGGVGWLRGINYHESVAGHIDRLWLDKAVPDMPLRIQHRSGRLWIFNSCALAALGARDGDPCDPLERIDGRLTGRLYDADDWMRTRIPGARPSLTRASHQLARFGVIGITDAGVNNGISEFQHFVAERQNGGLLQDILVMGGPQLNAAGYGQDGVRCGPSKLYLRESALPDIEDFCAQILHSRKAGRAVAIHAVTLVELIFALGALRHCGKYPGDRVEHASIAPPEALEMLAAQGLTVVTQPNFVHERGDAYLADVDPADLPWLYRARGFINAGIPLAAGTDAPYGNANPWLAMAAAVNRQTAKGHELGYAEALTAPEAVRLFTGPAASPGQPAGRIQVGSRADLSILDRPWSQAYTDLASVNINATIKDGRPIWMG